MKNEYSVQIWLGRYMSSFFPVKLLFYTLWWIINLCYVIWDYANVLFLIIHIPSNFNTYWVYINYYCVFYLTVIFIFTWFLLYLLIRMLFISAFWIGRVRKYTYSYLHIYAHTSIHLIYYLSIIYPSIYL